MPAALPSPVDLGFPSKFATWYPDQIAAIDRIVLNDRRFTALIMPTGGGKSVTGIAAALLHAQVKRTLYVTSTKGLQDQAALDFQALGLFDVRGARNYPCKALDHGGELERYRRTKYLPGCDEGPCHAGVRCSHAPSRREPGIRPTCTYYRALYDARRAPLVIANYAMYLAISEYGEGLGPFDLVILDEAHDIDRELESFLALDITPDDVSYLRTSVLDSTDPKQWRDWALHHCELLRSRLAMLDKQPPTDADGSRERRILKAIFQKLERLADIDPFAWVIDKNPVRVRCAPIQVAKYCERYMFRAVPHVVLMSATMTRKTTQLLGIDPDTITFHEVPSRFPLSHRPVICVNTSPSVRVDARMKDDDRFMWLRRIDRLIEPRLALGRKGIIHTVSYKRAQELLLRSEWKAWMLVHDSSNTREVIRDFKARTGPWILVSPSIVTGYDFPGDECRYQILGKVPLPDMREPVMKLRGELDKQYSGYLAMQKLVQAAGRAVRGPRDWAETFIVDDHFSDWFYGKYRQHAPRWFRDAVEYVESFPSPLMIGKE